MGQEPAGPTVFSSGTAATDILQADKEAYLFAVKSYDKNKVWVDENNDPVYKIKLSSSELKNDVPSSPHLIDIDDDAVYDRIYVGNLYGNLYRAKDIGFLQKPRLNCFLIQKTRITRLQSQQRHAADTTAVISGSFLELEDTRTRLTKFLPISSTFMACLMKAHPGQHPTQNQIWSKCRPKSLKRMPLMIMEIPLI